ncbi:MAG: hypothetical protein KIT36_12590 [Alphaproteobacteria bacterium]|nr:hypothetical protein [Alphaproteobacteria bacterium]
MLLLTHSDPAFTKLILEDVPRIAKMPLVRAAMKKYTSGYLTDSRLTDATSAGTFPMVELGAVGGGASGQQVRDTIRIDSSYFKGFKEGHPTYVMLVPITVFHEMAHWGYWKGQDEGHPSDKFGREHNNHGEYMSPLNAELQRVFQMVTLLSGPIF